MKKYPKMEIVATVYGDWQAAKTLEEISKIMPSLSEVDAVLTQSGGDSYGVVQAFEQNTELGLPMIYGDNTAEFMSWWNKKIEESGYVTESSTTTPSISQTGLWITLAVLNGFEVPKTMSCPLAVVTQEEANKYADMAQGTVVCKPVPYSDVINNTILPSLNK
jgi:ribose transport system substrate-binding protein